MGLYKGLEISQRWDMTKPEVRRRDALILDLDGTLWDTCDACAGAWNRVLGRLGIAHRPITAADLRSVAGRPHTEGIRRVFPDLSEEQLRGPFGGRCCLNGKFMARVSMTLHFVRDLNRRRCY